MFSLTPAARRNIAYWVATALLEFEFVLGGIWDVLRVPHVREVVDRLGYPEYFLIILGVWKLLGAIALVIPRFPRLKEWTYAGAIFNFTGAIASHLIASDIETGALTYLTFMIVVTFASWALRPPSRRYFPILRRRNIVLDRAIKGCPGVPISRVFAWMFTSAGMATSPVLSKMSLDTHLTSLN